MKKPFLKISGKQVTLSPFQVYPIEGFEKPTNKETGKEFPYCCAPHKEMFQHVNEWFKRFPNCCAPHKTLAKQPSFNIRLYDGLPDKILLQLAYTEHQIQTRINNNDWYEDITEYIEYNLSSFGYPEIGADKYLSYLNRLLSTEDHITPNDKRLKLLAFVEKQQSPQVQSHTGQTDFNVLYSVYEEWLKAFPFEISFLNHLKERFEKKLPFIQGQPMFNRYMPNVSKFKAHTKQSLIDALCELTQTLIRELNTLKLYESKQITEPQKLKLELIVAQRRQKLLQGYTNNSSSEDQRYRKALKVWLKDEIKFIKDITPLLSLPAKTPLIETNKRKSTKEIIEEQFDLIHQNGWQYAFNSQIDYNTFVGILTAFFEYRSYELPEHSIKLKRTTKTRVAKALSAIHRELSEKPLSSDLEFFEIVKVLNHFEKETNLAKTLTR